MVVETEASRGISLPLERERNEEEVRRLYENAPIGFAATVINASILAGILRDWIEPSTLLLWWTSLMGLTAIRFALGEWFRRVASKQDFDPGRWIVAFVAAIFAAGLIWGSAGIWLLPQSVAHQTFVAFVLGGMVAGASATFSIRMDAFLAYTVPALAPLAIRFVSMGDELHVAMGVMVILFGLLLTATAHRVHQLTSRTCALSGELLELRSTLKRTSEGAEALEASLARAEAARAEMARDMEAMTEKTEERIRRFFVDITEAAAGGAESLVDEIVAYAGGNVAPVRSTDVGDFMRSFARRWESFRPANIDVWWNCSEPIAVRADPPTLEIVFRQLLANSREAIGDERGTIEVRARRAPNGEKTSHESFVTVEVVDDGAGMSKTTLDRLFDPFFSTKSRERGLGMAIVKSLVNRLNGKILVESASLRGTQVRLFLPGAPMADAEDEENVK
jgi:signal transduction histidine kinase